MAFLHLDLMHLANAFMQSDVECLAVHFITYTMTVKPTACERLCVITQFIAQKSDCHVLQKKKHCTVCAVAACSQFSLTKISFEPCYDFKISLWLNILCRYLFICPMVIFLSMHYSIGKIIVLLDFLAPFSSCSFLV